MSLIPRSRPLPPCQTRPRRRGPEHAQAGRRTREGGRTKEAIELLETLTKSYKGTKTAEEAKEALERPKQNLPLFLDRPTVKADAAPPPEPPPPPAPRQVVKRRAEAGQGECHPDLAGQSGRADAVPPLAAGDGHHSRHGSPNAGSRPPASVRIQGQRRGRSA